MSHGTCVFIAFAQGTDTAGFIAFVILFICDIKEVGYP